MQPQRLPDAPEESSKPKKQSRVRSLDGMRFFVQIWIILGHYWMGRDDDSVYLHRFVSRGGIGVTFYIVLSGFMTFIGFSKKPIKEYYCRRIIPMLALNNFAQLISINAITDFSSIHFWMTAIMCTSAYGQTPPLNGPLWTLSTLFFCWLVFPLFRDGTKMLSQRNRIISLPIILTLAGLPWIIVPEHSSWVRKFPPFRMLDFYLAMTCASLVKETFLFDSNYSWLWLYSSDLAVISILSLGALTPCIEEGCRSPFIYKMLEGPLGAFIWLICIYGFFYKADVTNVGITRRLFNHEAVLLLAKGGTTFCAYVLQDPVYHWLSDHPICYLLTLWTLAIIVNDYMFTPISMAVRKWFLTPNIPEPEIAEPVVEARAKNKLKRSRSNSKSAILSAEHSAPLIDASEEDNIPAIISRENIILQEDDI